MIDVPLHYENVELGEFVVMPNHVHAVIMIHDNFGGTQASHLLEDEKNSKQHNKLSVIAGSYKSSVTKNVNLMTVNKDFVWQRYFHDHIIRNTKSLERISDYIRMNPERWNENLENEKYLTGLSKKERDKRTKTFYGKLSS
jgi:REP element-mobilizing transposase RayT